MRRKTLEFILAGLLLTAPALRAAEFAVATDGGGYVDATLGGGDTLANNWSFSAWVYFTEGGSYAVGDSPLAVVTSQESIAFGASAEVLIDGDVNGVQRLELGRSNGYIGEHSTLPIPTNQWTHIAITVSASKVVRHYINGQPAGVFDTQYAGRNVALGHVGSGLIRLMGNFPGGRKFKGGLDDVQIWNTERSAAEIQAAMSTPPAGNEPNLVAWFRFNEGTGTSAANGDTLNASGAATLVDAVTWVPGIPDNFVINANDSGAGSLRQVIAGATSGAIVTFAPNLSGQTILLTSGQLLLNKNLTIDGSALPGGIQINGNAASRVFYVTNGVATVLKSLTIANGLAPEGVFAVNGGGGGIFSRGRVDLLNCSVVSNTVASGSSFAGGIGCDHGDVRLTNCTVAFNQVLTGGSYSEAGAFYNFVGTFILDHCTVASNQATYVNGGYANGGSTTLRATVMANGNTDLYNVSGGASLGNNLITDGSNSGVVNGVNGDQVGTAGSPLNALLSPLGNYGGPTPTMLPLLGSPVIDAGGAGGLTTDQRGFPRPLDADGNGSAVADIGAVEFQASLLVTTVADTGEGSLRAAIFTSTNGSTVTFATNLSGATIVLTNGELRLNQNLTVDASTLGITVSGGNASRIFIVTNNQTLSLVGLTLTGGNGVGTVGSYGGAIRNLGNLALTRCTFSANSAGTEGGAIYNPGGMLSLTNCTLSGNSSAYGGAIGNSGGSVTLTHCTLAGNSSALGGGAIESYNFGSLNLIACILAGNTDTSETGPDLWMDNGSLTAFNCLIGDGKDSTLTNGMGGNQVGTTGSPINPLLGALANNGGSTQTRLPLPGSPAIDAASVIAGLTTDQRGVGFPRTLGSAPDIGAVESAYPEIAVQQPAGVNLVDGTASINYGTVNLGSGSAARVFTITNRGGSNLILTNLTTDGANPGDFIVSSLFSFSPLPASDFNSNDGGFTVNTPQSYDGPWTYSSGTGSWRENGQAAESGHANTSYLISPTTTLTSAGVVELTFAHRWSFEPGDWDGGQVQISVNGAAYVIVPGAAFTQNGYNGSVLASSASLLAGQVGFISESTGHASSLFIQSKATLGTFNAGDTLAVRFVAASDTNTRGDQPCWEITSFALAYSVPALAPGASTTFTVQFVPTSAGARTATLHIVSNDSDENPFDITLTGTGSGVNPVAFNLGSLTRLANGTFRFGFTNVTGSTFTVFGTTNVALPFNQWSNLGPAVETPPGSGQFLFTDSQATNHPTRFYRAKSP